MKIVISMWVLICLVGGISSSGAQEIETQLPTALTLEEVRRVEQSLPCLKTGMSGEEVYEILGPRVLAEERSGSGPSDDYRVVHYLRHGYNLILVWDEERKFKRAEMAGERWRKEQEQKKSDDDAGSPTSPCSRPPDSVPPN